MAGTYYEHVVVNRSITLLGESNSTMIIHGSGSGNIVEVIANGIVIDGFTVQNGSSGIYVISGNNMISNNSIANIPGVNGVSGYYGGSDGANGTGYSIYLNGSTSNLLYHNNLKNTDKNGYNDSYNLWDNGYTSGGNYGSDYAGIDANADGIGDIPYNNISGSAGSQDRYPLMGPWNEDNRLIQLNSGWDLLSLPLVPNDTNINSVLSPISGNYSIVWVYNANDITDQWKKYDPTAPFGNDLTTMGPGKGYWIIVDVDDVLI